MNSVAPTSDFQADKAEWQLISEALLRVGEFSSLDDLLYYALNAWIQQLSPSLRWQAAVDLYTTEQVSLGRAAEIAGLNYFVFMEKLDQAGIPLVEAEIVNQAQVEKQQALIDDILNIPEA